VRDHSLSDEEARVGFCLGNRPLFSSSR
jgi:hypothetical protein